MAKQKKILDINEGRTHLVCLRLSDPKEYNPYRIYLIISPTGAPIRKRLLEKYGDFPSVLCFIRNFYIEGINTMCYTEMVRWIQSNHA